MSGKFETINSILEIFFKPNMYRGGSRTTEATKTELVVRNVTVSSL